MTHEQEGYSPKYARRFHIVRKLHLRHVCFVVEADLEIAFPRHRERLLPLHSRSSGKNSANA
jgi:hypothetical protein